MLTPEDAKPPEEATSPCALQLLVHQALSTGVSGHKLLVYQTLRTRR
jgi:hypothetical protein